LLLSLVFLALPVHGPFHTDIMCRLLRPRVPHPLALVALPVDVR